MQTTNGNRNVANTDKSSALCSSVLMVLYLRVLFFKVILKTENFQAFKSDPHFTILSLKTVQCVTLLQNI